MSVRTVTTHIERILVKLSQMGRTGAATLATDLGCSAFRPQGRS